MRHSRALRQCAVVAVAAVAVERTLPKQQGASVRALNVSMRAQSAEPEFVESLPRCVWRNALKAWEMKFDGGKTTEV